VKVKDLATNPTEPQCLNIASTPQHSATKQGTVAKSASVALTPRQIKDAKKAEAKRQKDALEILKHTNWTPQLGIDRPVPIEYWNERGAKMRRRAAMRRKCQILFYGLLAILVLIVVGIVLIYYTVRHFQSK